ncbi:PAS-domain containing protein [Pannonibacter phragmitetus]|uniref:PAS-domain containing protein n=1 Tax=Pannonibacter phragmitetus TaxID=121719 RepID=UPI003D2F285C
MTISSGTTEYIDMLQAALDHVNQGFSVFDANLQLVAWNRGLWEMLDFPQELARRGAHLAEFLRVNTERGEYGPGDVEGKIQRRLERARQFVPHYFERIRPNGQVIAVRGTPLPQGGFVTIYSDITEERRRQEKLERTVAERTRALRQSEDWLRFVTDNIPALVAYMGPEESAGAGPVFRFANRRYAEWFGHSVASIAGRGARDVLGAELYTELQQQIAHAFSGHAVSYEYSRRKPNGELAYMRSTLIPDMTVDRRTLGVFVLSLDATDQKRNEAALAQSQRMDAVGKLTGGLAHDFNNLLAILMGNLLSLKRKGNDVTPADVQAHLAPMLQAAQRGADLTQRMLAFSRGQSSDLQTVELAPLLANTATLLHGSLPGSISLSFDLAEARLVARVDPAQLETAIVNLVFNARDAMPEGGSITVSLAREQLAERDLPGAGLAAGAYARISVRDTGQGMDEATQQRAFEPFFTTKPFGTGSGLGLSMVYGLARQAGGHADISTAPGAGTTVSLVLPLSASAGLSGTEPDGMQTALAMGSGELILLVEDEAAVAEAVALQIRDLGFTVLTAESPADALELARGVPEIRAVLSDVVMPGQMNGLALVQQIRQERPDIGIALMSGYADYGAPVEGPGQPPAQPVSRFWPSPLTWQRCLEP